MYAIRQIYRHRQEITLLHKVIADSGYSGPVGIIDHRPETDSETTLRENLDGLTKLLAR